VNPLLSLSPLLLGDEEIPLPLGLFDFIVELTKRSFELLGLLSLGGPGLLNGSGPLGVLLLPDKSLLGQVVSAFLHRQHGPVLPIPGLFDFVVQLRPELSFVGDGCRHLPLGLGQLVPHIQNDLIQHLLGVLRPSNQIVDVRF